MGYCVQDFVITKGIDNVFTITVKADGSTLPLTLTPSDTFTIYLKKLNTDEVVLTKNGTLDSNLESGKVHFQITSSETSTLESKKGQEVDRFYLIPTYKLIIDANTANNGQFIATIPEVYVD